MDAEEWERAFRQADFKHDGRIDVDEFVVAMGGSITKKMLKDPEARHGGRSASTLVVDSNVLL